jgi:hypothetical protein
MKISKTAFVSVLNSIRSSDLSPSLAEQLKDLNEQLVTPEGEEYFTDIKVSIGTDRDGDGTFIYWDLTCYDKDGKVTGNIDSGFFFAGDLMRLIAEKLGIDITE